MIRRPVTGLCLAGLLLAATGCVRFEQVSYPGGTDDVNYYVEHAAKIDYPHVHDAAPDDLAFSQEPRTLLEPGDQQVRDMTLQDCVRLALMNSRIIRSRGTFLSPGNPILASPNNVASVYDPAIQETGVLFGGRGVEAALAAFDAQLSTTAVWGRNEQIQNSVFAAGTTSGATLVSETAAVQNSLTKTFGYGGTFELDHNVNYGQTNVPPVSRQFASVYTGIVQAQYRHPLLAGSGTEFTRVAGPISNAFGGLTGVNQGVVIARINHDISLTDLESDVTNLLKDVEDLYWELYLQYRVYDTNVAARNSAYRTWRDGKRILDVGGIRGFSVEDEAQARDRYFDTRGRTQQALSQLYKAESALRRLIGMPVNDGDIIRTADEPLTAKLDLDWAVSVAEGVTHRVELRRHKWNIKSLELQLTAAQNLVRPRLDFVSSYAVNGFGDDLLDSDGGQPLSSMYQSITDGRQTGWSAGFIFQLPIGLRSARAQVENLELRLNKAREVQAAQELEVAHEIGNAFQELAESYVTAQSFLNRRKAAYDRVRLFQEKLNAGTQTIDLLLRAQASLADAEVAYYQSLVSYNKAITNLHYRQGTLLPHDSVFMEEGGWDPEAYADALRRARERSNGFDASRLKTTLPIEFVETDPHWQGMGYVSHGEMIEPGTLLPVPGDAVEAAHAPASQSASDGGAEGFVVPVDPVDERGGVGTPSNTPALTVPGAPPTPALPVPPSNDVPEADQPTVAPPAGGEGGVDPEATSSIPERFPGDRDGLRRATTRVPRRTTVQPVAGESAVDSTSGEPSAGRRPSAVLSFLGARPIATSAASAVRATAAVPERSSPILSAPASLARPVAIPSSAPAIEPVSVQDASSLAGIEQADFGTRAAEISATYSDDEFLPPVRVE